jgi:hypothetical protein
VARDVAAEWRAATSDLPFSDALFRQLADTGSAALDRGEARYRALSELLPQLPPPERELVRRRYELGLTTDQIAVSEGRPAAAINRELAGLLESLVSARYAAVPDLGPAPPGGAADLGRLASQLLDGTIGDDSRLVLETLLLADPPAQAHYHRHATLVADLTWKYRGPPRIPDPPDPPPAAPAVSRQEWWVTAAFVAACVLVAAFVVLLFTGRLG